MKVENNDYAYVTIVQKNIKDEKPPKKILKEDKNKEKKKNPSPQQDSQEPDEEGHIDRYV